MLFVCCGEHLAGQAAARTGARRPRGQAQRAAPRGAEAAADRAGRRRRLWHFASAPQGSNQAVFRKRIAFGAGDNDVIQNPHFH